MGENSHPQKDMCAGSVLSPLIAERRATADTDALAGASDWRAPPRQARDLSGYWRPLYGRALCPHEINLDPRESRTASRPYLPVPMRAAWSSGMASARRAHTDVAVYGGDCERRGGAGSIMKALVIDGAAGSWRR